MKLFHPSTLKKHSGSTLVLIVLFAFQMSPSLSQSTSNQEIAEKPLVVFLVRHAEKTLQKQDPELTPSGQKRAMELANILRSSQIEYVHSSDYVRTRDTAAPTAEAFGLTTGIYNPRDLKSLAEKIKSKGGTHLVVGHSNTTPALVYLLGGDPMSEINEAAEYDRLYIITDSGDCDVQSVLMRYGQAYSEPHKN